MRPIEGSTHHRQRRLTGATAALLACGLALSGCAGSSANPADSSSAGTPQTTVRLGVLGGPSDTLDITKAGDYLPYAVLLNTYDSLVLLNNGRYEKQLATSITPNATATEWTITLRPGVTFSNGKPLTAKDALYSLGYFARSKNFGSFYSDVDFARSTATDDSTLVLRMKRPRADLVDSILAQMSAVFPAGTTDFTRPIGSGPYEVKSFSADKGASLERNDSYWGGRPAIKNLQILPIRDASARVSALRDGQIDITTGITATQAKTLGSGAGVVVDNPGFTDSVALTFHMNTAIAPFNDPEVRQAMKTGLNRTQLVNVVLPGTGKVGNDLIGEGLPGYPKDLPPRAYDPEKAKAVFARHGVKNVGIIVSEMTPGLTDATKLLKQQLADLGVTLTITQQDPTTLWSNLDKVYASQMFTNFFTNRPPAMTLPIYQSPDSPYNFSQWKDPAYAKALTESQTLTDPAARAQALTRAQTLLRDNGGDIVWGYQPNLGAHVNGLKGITSTQSVPLFAKATFTR
ncbi:MAG: ABC transporter substrate-binding protein [Acidipropionibacterium sp.]|jgi:peptide/nickel transport system substrate-binding protein|nr:ABC transporter substrate-binding protein [Acidipropionibacterium sp.]